jgi:GDPmannose 4,6-dehydratase
MTARTALITGITGQDGTYLSELLVEHGYHVVGTSRSAKGPTASRLADLGVELEQWDLRDEAAFEAILRKVRPHEIYNLAAYTEGIGMYDGPVAMGEINGLVVPRILEAIRTVDPAIRFCQASSSEIFGDALESPQRETTPANPRNPYGAAKLYGHNMIRIYRNHFKLFGCSAILFNHESPRRSFNFVTRKVANAAAAVKLRLVEEVKLGNLDARRDWGFAGDFARAMWLMLQADQADDYVIASGETHSVRELCEVAFGRVGLDYRDYVRVSADDYRPPEARQLVGDPAKARQRLGWAPTVSFREIIHTMVDTELEKLSVAVTD